MSIHTAIMIVICVLIGYLVIDRICKCFEQCAIAKAFATFNQAGAKFNPNDLFKSIKGFTLGDKTND